MSAHPPLILLHGFLGGPSSWDGLVGAHELRLLPGHGPTPWLPSGATFLDVVDELARAMVFDHPAWVVGYSMGARLALALALRYPKRVAGAMLIGGHPGLRSDEERAARQAWDDAQAASLQAGDLAAFVAAWEMQPLFASQAKLPPAVWQRQHEQRLAHTPAGLAWAMRVLGLGRMPSFWQTLEQAPVPLHFVVGELDEKFKQIAKEASSLAPRATLTIIPDVGHNVLLEAPERLAQELARLLNITKGNRL